MSMVINPFWGSAGGATSDINYAVGGFALPTATGSFDRTISGLGWTPKGAILSSTTNTTDNANNSSEAQRQWGATDGTNSFSFDIKGPTAAHSAFTGYPIKVANGLTWRTSSPSFISDGIRQTLDDGAGQASLMNAILFGGADCDVVCGTFTGPNTTEHISLGFEPRLIFFFSPWDNFGVSDTYPEYSMFAYAAYDGTTITQGGVFQIRSTAGGPNDCQGAVYDGIFPLSNQTITVTSMDNTGFDLSASGNASGQQCGYIAVGLGSRKAKVEVVAFPNATGNADLGAASFTPRFALIHSTRHTASNTWQTNGESSAFSIGCTDGTRSRVICSFAKDAVSNDCHVRQYSEPYYNVKHDGTALFYAPFVGFISGGIRLNFTGTIPGAVTYGILVTAE